MHAKAELTPAHTGVSASQQMASSEGNLSKHGCTHSEEMPNTKTQWLVFSLSPSHWTPALEPLNPGERL